MFSDINMFQDIVFPDNNEEEFINIALRLGIDSICFCYPQNINIEVIRNNLSKLDKKGLDISVGVILDAAVKKPALQQIDLQRQRYRKYDLVVFRAGEAALNRSAAEQLKPDIMFGFEDVEKKDFMHQRGGSLNQIICRLLVKGNITYVFSFSSILHNKAQRRATVIGRMFQNYALCKKFKVKSKILSMAYEPSGLRTAHDLSSFLAIFDAKT